MFWILKKRELEVHCLVQKLVASSSLKMIPQWVSYGHAAVLFQSSEFLLKGVCVGMLLLPLLNVALITIFFIIIF